MTQSATDDDQNGCESVRSSSPYCLRVFVVFGVTQNLTDTDAVQRRTSVDARVHAQVVLGVDLVKIDDAAFVDNAQMHNLASQFVDAPHAGSRLAEDVQVGQGWRAQPSQRS